MYKNGRWATQMLSYQRENGSFGFFHTLSKFSGSPVTTEQALRRLLALGYTIEDAPIKKTYDYIINCLENGPYIPDRREKGHAWDFFVELMLCVWIRKFDKNNERANLMYEAWTEVMKITFASGAYVDDDYATGIKCVFGDVLYGPRLLDFVTFYQVSLLAGMSDKVTEKRVLEYIIHHERGIYYVSDGPATELPEFHSLEGSRYLTMLEILADYNCAPEVLSFAADWIESNRLPDGRWDLGSKAKDKVVLPYSDNWRDPETRISDCTYRVTKLLSRLGRDT